MQRGKLVMLFLSCCFDVLVLASSNSVDVFHMLNGNGFVILKEGTSVMQRGWLVLIFFSCDTVIRNHRFI